MTDTMVAARRRSPASPRTRPRPGGDVAAQVRGLLQELQTVGASATIANNLAMAISSQWGQIPAIRAASCRQLVDAALRAPDEEVRESSRRALNRLAARHGRTEFGELHADFRPAWEAWLESEDDTDVTWQDFFRTLEAFMPFNSVEGVAIVGRCIRWGEMENPAISTALLALCKANPSALAPLRALVTRMFKRDEPQVVAAAARVAGRFGEEGESYVPDLVDLVIDNPNQKVAAAAATSIAVIDPLGESIDITVPARQHIFVACLEYGTQTLELQRILTQRWRLDDADHTALAEWRELLRRKPRLLTHLLWLQECRRLIGHGRNKITAYETVMLNQNRRQDDGFAPPLIEDPSTIRKGIQAAGRFLQERGISLADAIDRLTRAQRGD